MAKRKPTMITPKQYAEQIETPYPTVMRWLQKELIPGAEKRELPFGGWYYAIPEGTPPPDLKPGPKPKSAGDGEVSTATDAPDDGMPSAVTGRPAKSGKARKATSEQPSKKPTRSKSK